MGQNQIKNSGTMLSYTLFCMGGGEGGGGMENKWNETYQILTPVWLWNSCCNNLLAVAETVRSLPPQSDLNFPFSFKVLSIQNYGRTNNCLLEVFLALLLPPLLEVHGALCHKNNFNQMKFISIPWCYSITND